ncbi:MAG: hypothetical protein V3W34_17460 [Phycisphaerae bacterium]
MLNRLLIVRLKAAEKALKTGRLDEAYRLASARDIREHRRGAAVLGKLTDKLIERARAHFADERFAEALNDLAKAEGAGGRLEAVAELRQHVLTVAEEVARQERSRRVRMEQAKERVQRGSLAAGQQLLAGVDSGDADAQRLANDIKDRQHQAAEGLAKVERLIKQRQLAAAVEQFRKVKPLDPHSSKIVEIETTLCDQVVAGARAAFADGRFNRATEELAGLGPIGRTSAGRRDMEEILELSKNASRALEAGDFEEARRIVLRLQRLTPKVSWVNKVADQLGKLDELLTALYGGPLGEHAGLAGASPSHVDRGGARKDSRTSGRTPPPSENLNDTVLLADRPAGGDRLPDRLLVLVDGGGSYLLLRKDRLSIGRAMTDNQPDIPIHSDLAERHAEVSRVDDDYFLFSSREIEVDGRATRHQLLRPGNRVTLGRNAKFTFRMPHRQSPSGIIDLSGSTRMPNDVRRVVLFRRTAMIGFGKNAHINCNTAERDLVLFERGGRLWVRPQRNGRVETEAQPLVIGKQMELAGVSFVVQPWKTPWGCEKGFSHQRFL